MMRQRKGNGVSTTTTTTTMREEGKKNRSSATTNGGIARKKTEFRVFSENEDKAWAEKWFLLYSPIWPMLFGAWCVSGYHLHVGDFGNFMVTVLLATPNILVPMMFCPSRKPMIETYWFKFSLWMWIFGFVASYFFTEYFFDVLGMVYNFPHLSWTFDSVLVGSGKQVVPAMMYLHAWYFFITYHTCSVIFIRVIRTSTLGQLLPFGHAISVLFAAWLFAWGEIYGTTMEAIRDQFHYKDMDWALTWGALCYSCYFIPSFPMVYEMDEKRDVCWTIGKTVENALAASMLAFILLDVVTQHVITGWQTFEFHKT